MKSVIDIKSKASQTDIFGVYNSSCLKGIAIIMLVAHHCFLGPGRYKGQEIIFIIPENIWNYVALFFKICVCFFVFISAYGLTKKMMILPENDPARLHASIKDMIISRIFKLLGSFMFVFVLVTLFGRFYDPGRFTEIYGSVFPDAAEYYFIDMLGLAELLGTPTYLGTFWYYSLAIVIILIIPAFYYMQKKLGSVGFLAVVAVINFTVNFDNRNIWHYIFCIAIGVVCACENLITRLVNLKLNENKTFNAILKFMLEAIFLFILMFLREGPLKGELYPFWDAIIPVVMAIFCCEFIFHIPVLHQVLAFLGRYSVNIFLVHNFIRITWFYDFTYSFKYPLVIVIVLLINSLILSLIIERMKSFLRYDQFINKLIHSCCKWEKLKKV